MNKILCVKRFFVVVLSFVMTLCMLGVDIDLDTSITVSAASTYTISVKSKEMYSMSYAALDLINADRTASGVSKLTMDETLLEIAAQRAAEISLYFSHTRPDGSSFNSGFDYASSCAENIAYGQTTAAKVYSAWKSSSGHYSNYMNSTYKRTGLACAYINGTYYWVQVFDNGTADSISQPSNTTVTRTIKASSSNASGYVPTSTPKITSITNSGYKVTLKWEKVSNANGYRIYKYDSTTKSYKKIKTITSASTLKYTDKTTNGGDTAKYVIKAYRKNGSFTGWTAKSSAKSIKTSPSTPTMKSASKTQTAVRINWSSVDCDGYKIYKYNSSTKKYELIKKVSGSTTTYRLSGLKKGTAYKFKVRAYYINTAGNYVYSGYTSVKKVTTKS